MNRDKITFNQTHWNNRSAQKKKNRKQKGNGERDRSEKHHSLDAPKENIFIHDYPTSNTIYSPLNTRGKNPSPVISPPSKILDEEINEMDNYEGYEEKNGEEMDPSFKKVGSLEEKRKRMSSFRQEFFSMLDHVGRESEKESSLNGEEQSSSFYDGSEEEEKQKQGNPFLAEFLSMLGESSDDEWNQIEEQEGESEEGLSFDIEEYSILKDIVSSIENSAEGHTGFKNHYLTQNEMIQVDPDDDESSSVEIWNDMDDQDLSTNESSDEGEHSLFSEISSLLDDSSSSWEDESDDSVIEESSSAQSPSASIEAEDEAIPIAEDLSAWIESESTDDEESSSLHLEERSPCSEFLNREVREEEIAEEEHTLLVKIPVLLSSVSIDVDIMESLEVLEDVSEITKIDWSLHSIKSNVVLPSRYVFFYGVLVADIEYISEGSMQTVKIPIHWEKVVEVNWQREPLLSSTDQKEYTLTSSRENGLSTHNEFYQAFANPVEDEVQNIYFISHNNKHGNGELSIQGSARICIDLSQQQYVHL